MKKSNSSPPDVLARGALATKACFCADARVPLILAPSFVSPADFRDSLRSYDQYECACCQHSICLAFASPLAVCAGGSGPLIFAAVLAVLSFSCKFFATLGSLVAQTGQLATIDKGSLSLLFNMGSVGDFRNELVVVLK